MTSGEKSRSNSISLLKLNEEVDELISSENKKTEGNIASLKNILGDEDDLNNNKIPEDFDKKILEIAEKREFELANSKKKRFRKRGLDLLNEQLDALIKKTINEEKTESKGTDSISKKSRRGRKKLVKRKNDSDEEYDISQENNNNSITLIMNSDSNNNYDNNYYNLNDESSEKYGEEKELMEFINKKTCRNGTLKKYKDRYEKMKRNKNIIKLYDSDDNSEDIKENKDNKNIELNGNKDEKKHLKRLKKNTDNKEMKLPLETECIICTNEIKELANPDGCNHDFCKACLIEWSQRSSKCPMCKTPYKNIFTYDTGIKKQMSIFEIRNKYKKLTLNENENENDEENNESDDESNIEDGCYICGKNTDQGNLLECDRCRGNYCHYYCIHLKKIPEGKWYCEYCIKEIKERRLNKKKVEHFFL